jgi:hypothetical protein
MRGWNVTKDRAHAMSDDYSTLSSELKYLLWKLEVFDLQDWARDAAFERLDQVAQEIDSAVMRLCSKLADMRAELDGESTLPDWLEKIPLPRDGGA